MAEHFLMKGAAILNKVIKQNILAISGAVIALIVLRNHLSLSLFLSPSLSLSLPPSLTFFLSLSLSLHSLSLSSFHTTFKSLFLIQFVVYVRRNISRARHIRQLKLEMIDEVCVCACV